MTSPLALVGMRARFRCALSGWRTYLVRGFYADANGCLKTYGEGYEESFADNTNYTMNRREQREFVRELTNRIREEVVDLISDETTPAEWDGHELRCVLADRFEASAQLSTIRKEPRSKRAQEFKRFTQTSPKL